MQLTTIHRSHIQRWRLLSMLGIMLAAVSQVILADEVTVNAKDLQARIAELQPNAAESEYDKIPWRTDLLLARREALRDRKPIFLWIMNGSPLGCT